MIQAVIFDMGGVIARTVDPVPRQRLAARLGMDLQALYTLVFESESAKMATLGRMTVDEHWAAIGKKLGASPIDLPAIEQDFFAGDVVDMELIEYIRGLRKRYKTGLLSNAWNNTRPILIQRWGIGDAFDDMVISAEVGCAKPDPKIYHTAVERLNVHMDEAVFVDDFQRNLDAAASLGMYVVHFQDPTQARLDLEKILNGTM